MSERRPAQHRIGDDLDTEVYGSLEEAQRAVAERNRRLGLDVDSEEEPEAP